MKEKTNYSSLTKFFAVSLLVWVCQYSNESSAIDKSRIEEHGKNNSLAARAGRVLREDEEVIAEQRNAFLKEKLIGLIEDGQENPDDNFNFAKRFNALIQEENFQKGLNSLMKDENKSRQTNPYEYDDNIAKWHNTFNFNGNNKNPKKDVNLIEFEDFGKVEYFQKLNNKPQKQTNPFTVTKNSTGKSGSSNLYSPSAKQVNTVTTPTVDFEKLHNSINVNRQPAKKETITTPTVDFEKLHNSINVNRQPAKKPTIVPPVDSLGKQQNSQNVNKQPTKEPKPIDPTDDIFAKLQNTLILNKPIGETLNLYRDNDDSDKSYNTLNDDLYYQNLFNSACKAYSYESDDITHDSQYFYEEPRRYPNYKNDYNDLNENVTPNAHSYERYKHLLEGNNFESEKRVLKNNVDDQPKNDSEKPLINSSEHFPKESYEKNHNDMGKGPYTASRLSALSYVQNVEKLLNKLKYFNNVETAVEELKNDPSFKKILDELQNGNGVERLFYVLKYSEDSEGILSELKKNDNIEKLVYVLNHYENNSKSPKKKESKKESKKVASKKNNKGRFKLSLFKIKKKKLVVLIVKLFKMFDQMYEKQLLSIFDSELDESTDNNKFIHNLKYTKILIPFVFAAILMIFIALLQNVTYYISIAVIIVATIGYTAFKVKKCRYKKKIEKKNTENEKKPSKPTIIRTDAS
ncbi:Uncharacterized protein PCOAH_00037330 [Plasmodium coatneyi]|uniref:Pv-fam-d protein n=1 Tax=Plasmodium coatneyi TaxID=208452 RepID=A0A1B1E4B4_9APIC|nr:Uncharacterized protein PCOAH_00037330 [Plasmodium coatneyi]ANQ09629.1 Uncharacterized protein PCOAH_00037330 [Plasmodium coatneyi]